jgi:SulP family sulfate permease
MESLSVARSLQAKHKHYVVDSNKELLSLGLANMIGSFFKSFPVSGGFSRSAVNEQAGAKSGLASIVSALLVVCALLLLTPLFYYMPNAILAAIIVVAVIKLIHVAEAKFLWKVDKKDFVMMMATFLSTLFFGIGTGIATGVMLSLAWIIFETSYPHHAQLGRIPGTRTYRNIRRFKELIVENDILIFRFDAPLFFANADRFREILLNHISNSPTKLQAIIVDMESTNSIDTSAINVLENTVSEIKLAGIKFLLVELKGPVRDKLWLAGLTKKIGEENFFMSIDQAMEFLAGNNPDTVNEIILQTNKG